MNGVLKKVSFALVLLFSVISLAAENKFYFVQITDTHVGRKTDTARTAEIIEQINKLPVDVKFIAVTGDIINTSGDEENLKEAARIFSKSKFKVHVVPGNHDIKNKTPDADARVFEENFGSLSSSFDCEGVTMIFFYSEPMREKFVIQSYNPIGILQEKLKNAGEKPVLLFTHAPPAPDMDRAEFRVDPWPADAAKILENNLKPYNIKAIIAGHSHRDDFYWFADIPVFICGAVSGKGGRVPEFRLYYYDNGRLSYTTQYFGKKK